MICATSIMVVGSVTLGVMGQITTMGFAHTVGHGQVYRENQKNNN